MRHGDPSHSKKGIRAAQRTSTALFRSVGHAPCDPVETQFSLRKAAVIDLDVTAKDFNALLLVGLEQWRPGETDKHCVRDN
jgi:hypothetical protein